MMKYFNIPGFADHFEINTWMLDFWQKHPEYFKKDVKISSVFGNFHFCVWDGGRNFMRYQQYTEQQMQQIIMTYNKIYRVPIRYVFTNPLLEKKHLSNRFGNLMLELAHDPLNEVVVNSALMEDYIREKYPKYKLISSTTKCITSPAQAKAELEKDYYQVCLDYNLNKNLKLLEEIPQELRGKVEFLSNAICHPKCPIRKEHYAVTGKAQLTYLKEKYDISHKCTITDSICSPNVLGKGNNLTNADIENYSQMGYKYFKLEGRTLESSSMLACYMYYLVNPDYAPGFIEQAAFVGQGIFFNDRNSDRTFIHNPIKHYSCGYNL